MDSVKIPLFDAPVSGKEHKYLDTKVAACVGMFSIVFFSVCWVLGIVLDGDWVWNEDVICRLGISEVEFVANMYLVSCVVTGIGLITCGFGMMRESSRTLEMFAFMCCMIFGVAMIGLGIIDMNDKEHHRIFSTAIMLFGIVTMVSYTIDDVMRHRYPLAIVTFIFGLMVLAILLTVPDAVQTISVVGMLVWLFIKCILKVKPDLALNVFGPKGVE